MTNAASSVALMLGRPPWASDLDPARSSHHIQASEFSGRWKLFLFLAHKMHGHEGVRFPGRVPLPGVRPPRGWRGGAPGTAPRLRTRARPSLLTPGDVAFALLLAGPLPSPLPRARGAASVGTPTLDSVGRDLAPPRPDPGVPAPPGVPPFSCPALGGDPGLSQWPRVWCPFTRSSQCLRGL